MEFKNLSRLLRWVEKLPSSLDAPAWNIFIQELLKSNFKKSPKYTLDKNQNV